MTILTNGSWARGCVHTIIDDQPIKPSVASMMQFFLKMSEEKLMSALLSETEQGTLTQGEANRVLDGYFKRTFNAYK